MEDKIGEEYEGIVSSVTNFGIFVELENTVEGLIRYENLGDEYFIYNEEKRQAIGEHTNKIYKIKMRQISAAFSLCYLLLLLVLIFLRLEVEHIGVFAVLCHKLLGKVKSSRGSRRRALGLGVDRLVAVAVGQPLGDVGGQRHQTDLVEDVVDVLVLFPVKVELDEAVALLHQLHHLARQHALSEHHAVAKSCALAGLHQTLPGVGCPLTEQEQLDPRFGSALGVTVKTGGNYL